MKRVVIICEGETEREFGKNILAPYFATKNIHIQSPLIKRSMGGVVKWNILKKEIATYLYEKHRLKRIIEGYNKVLYGHYFTEAIGLGNIRNKSPRFDEWMNNIETL